MNNNNYKSKNSNFNGEVIKRAFSYNGELDDLPSIFDRDELERMQFDLENEGIAYHNEIEDADDAMDIDGRILIGDYIRNLLAYMIAEGHINRKETAILMYYAKMLS